MLTRADEEFFAEHGAPSPERLRSLAAALVRMSRDSRAAAEGHVDGADSRAAAALRGKSVAYQEAALMVRQIATGCALHPRRWSSAYRLARAVNAGRRKRRSESPAAGSHARAGHTQALSTAGHQSTERDY